MGLPHILVRFYTNPDGSAARRTTVRVLGLLGAFYLFPAVYGLLGRAFTAELYVTGDTDSVVLRVPAAAWPGPMGDILAAIVAAGAFAAFMSTASGLLVSIAGTVSHDLWPGPRRRRRARFRIAAARGHDRARAARARHARGRHLGARRLGLRARRQHVLPAAAARRLVAAADRRPAAPPGCSSGAGVATGMIATGLIGDFAEDTALGAILTQPAAVSVPLAFGTMVLLSLRSRPPNVGATMAALHVPEVAQRTAA